MKIIQIILIPVLIFVTLSCNEHSKKSKNQEPISNTEIINVIDHFNTLMSNPNKAALEKLCADNLTYGHSSGLIQNKAEFIEDLVNGPFDFKSVTSPELDIKISGNTAIARFIFLATAIKDGETINIRLGCVQVFQKQDNGIWKLLARQAYKLPEPK